MNATISTRRGPWLTAILAAALGLLMLALPAAASARDRNHDKIPDRWEKRHSLSLKVKQTHRDQDRDQLTNRKEFLSGTDPHDGDSDEDGTEDGDEGAGTISAFDPATGELTISLFGGGDVTGTVTDETEVSCDNGDDNGDEDSDGEGGDDDQGGSGDDDVDEDEDAVTRTSSSLSDDDEGDDDQGDDDQGDDSDDDDQGEDGDDQGEDDDEHACSADDLSVGGTVQEAELDLEGGTAVWDEIELLVG
jgi:hypothetical protein